MFLNYLQTLEIKSFVKINIFTMYIAQSILCVFITVLLHFTAMHTMLNGSNAWCFKLKRNSKNQSAIVLFVEVTTVEKLAISLVLNTLSVNRPY